MTDEAEYLIYLIEHYALAKNITGKQALELFEERDLLPYIHDMYYTYHTERVENAIEDLDRRIMY
ncbi:MAG: DUF3791 domain-containing protein [Clostridiales Family XIII bacterium]|jgi:hypothetical protein|nr:DUF3791 domain-containing protein [Clostridiales Family XIII bacterium]